MKELTLETMIAVFEEIFGRGLFWVMVVLAAAITAAYLYVLVRDRAMSMRKFLLAQLAMPFGAVAAVLFVQAVTSSHFRDIGGPVDVIVLLGVAVVGAVGAAILVYTAQSLLRSKVPAQTVIGAVAVGPQPPKMPSNTSRSA
jgi:drug/metabolite transporter (DMT)-like permease